MKDGDVVLCTVKKIEKTSVFVETEDGTPGSIVFSEIAAGRIRNIRDYVSINKKIVCKVLKVHSDHLELSLRRVTGKERDEVLEKSQKERTLKSIIKASSKKPEEVIDKIKEEYDLSDFLDELRENPSLIEKFMSRSESEALVKILSEKKEKEKSVSRVVTIRSKSSIDDLKEILSTDEAEIHYLGSSQFSVKKSGRDYKEAEKQLKEVLEKIQKKAKEKQAFIEIKEKK